MLVALRALVAARLVFRLLRRDGADDAGHPDRRHDDGLVHANRSRDGGRDLVAVPRPRALPHHDIKALAKASFDTIETTASVLFIVTAASIFAWLLTVSQAARVFSNFMSR